MFEADPNGVDLQLQKIVSNIRLMAKAAEGKGIAPIVCSVLPVNNQYRLPAQDINIIVIRLNKELESMAKAEEIIYIDFWVIVVDQSSGMLKSAYSKDGLHPNEPAYHQMWELLVPHLK
jgi:lysophospholipase L1-like esterase